MTPKEIVIDLKRIRDAIGDLKVDYDPNPDQLEEEDHRIQLGNLDDAYEAIEDTISHLEESQR